MVDLNNDGQQTMDKWEGGIPLGISASMEFDDPADVYGEPPARLENELERFGLTPEVVGKTPEEIDSRWLTNIYRYQFFSEYLYEAGNPADDDETEVAPIQWRTSIFTIGHPSQALIDFIADHIHGRQKTLFDTGIYQDYFSNWMPFEDYHQNVEGPRRVGPNDVEAALGVPFFELEIYDEDDNLRGEARGYADPFRLEEVETDEPPQRVPWNIRYNPNRRGGTYEFAPSQAEARRLAGFRKTVSLNGRYIGRLQKSKDRGVYLSKEYATKDKTFADQHNGMQMWSRQKFIDEDVFPYQAVMRGGKVWKIRETDDHIALVATKPDDDFTDPGEVDESATGTSVYELLLSPDVDTRFEVREDNKIYGALGKYNPPFEREIDEETEFAWRDPMSGQIVYS